MPLKNGLARAFNKISDQETNDEIHDEYGNERDNASARKNTVTEQSRDRVMNKVQPV